MFLIPLMIFFGLVIGPSGFHLELPAFLLKLIQIAPIIFLFVSGLECTPHYFRVGFRKSLILALGAFVFPFIVGYLAAPFFGLVRNETRWFFAAALSVSALPVIIQILKDTKWLRHELGHTIISAAVICDLLAWACFFLILPRNSHQGFNATEVAIFSFFLGVLFTSLFKAKGFWLDGLHRLNSHIFAPLFFIGAGLQINIWDSFDIRQVVLVLALATLLKIIGVMGATHFLKLSDQQRWVCSFALNARGAMEIFMAGMALKYQLINSTWFSTLVLLGLLTSVISSPLIELQKRRLNKHEAALDCTH